MPRPKPEGLFDPMPAVTAQFACGRRTQLFHYYPDEINFAAHELLGLTEQAARDLHGLKLKQYFSSP